MEGVGLAGSQVLVQTFCWPQCDSDSDMQTQGRDLNQASGHSYFGECKALLFVFLVVWVNNA